MERLGLIIASGLLIAAGPISKFDGKTPVAEFLSSAKLEDVERCLIDTPGFQPPAVYRQPDRPDDVTII